MSSELTLADDISSLQRKAAHYRQLAEKMMDKRAAAEALRWAADLESEAAALKRLGQRPTTV